MSGRTSVHTVVAVKQRFLLVVDSPPVVGRSASRPGVRPSSSVRVASTSLLVALLPRRQVAHPLVRCVGCLVPWTYTTSELAAVTVKNVVKLSRAKLKPCKFITSKNNLLKLKLFNLCFTTLIFCSSTEWRQILCSKGQIKMFIYIISWKSSNKLTNLFA